MRSMTAVGLNAQDLIDVPEATRSQAPSVPPNGNRSVNEPAPEIGGDLNDAGPMEAALVHALLLEESPSDADKLEICLISSGLGLKSRRVASRRDYLDAIDAGGSKSSWRITSCRTSMA